MTTFADALAHDVPGFPLTQARYSRRRRKGAWCRDRDRGTRGPSYLRVPRRTGDRILEFVDVVLDGRLPEEMPEAIQVYEAAPSVGARRTISEAVIRAVAALTMLRLPRDGARRRFASQDVGDLAEAFADLVEVREDYEGSYQVRPGRKSLAELMTEGGVPPAALQARDRLALGIGGDRPTRRHKVITRRDSIGDGFYAETGERIGR